MGAAKLPYNLRFKHFEAAVGDVGDDNGGNAGDENGYTTIADSLDLDKGALDTIESATDNLHGSALGQIDLGGVEVDELLVIAVADGDELLHLAIGDHDGNTAGALGAGEVLEVIDLGLQRLDGAAGGVDKQQVVDGGDETTYLALLLVADNVVLHRDEATNGTGLKKLLRLERTTKRGTHGKPYGGLEKLGWRGGGHRHHNILVKAHSLGSPKG